MKQETALDELRDRYSALDSYRDTGVVLAQHAGSEFVDETEFSTAFVRADRFNFEWISRHPYPPLSHITTRHRIWANEAGISYWDEDDAETESESDLSSAISRAKGVSGNASYTVPNMLFGSPRTFASDLLSVQTIIDAETEGIPCRCIVASDSRNRPYRLYVGRDDLLLHRVSSSVMDGSSSDEIHREIRINAPIDHKVFA